MAIHARMTHRNRPRAGDSPGRSDRHRRALAGLLMAVLVVGSFAFLVGGGLLQDGLGPSSSPTRASSANGPSPSAAGRDPLLWPFSKDSIWNLPIGTDAVYVPAGIRQATSMGLQPDVDVLILTPNAPLTPVYYNGDAWNKIPGRCDAQGGVQFSAPIPADFVVLGNGMGSPHGNTPNYATAILDADGVTLIQGQPFARCTPGGTATIWWFNKNERLDGTGVSGAHGGSMLSSIGGTIRLGELVPGGTIPHAMKLNIDGVNYYGGLGGHRWPASTADSCAPGCYTGSIPAMRIGALLALSPSFDMNQLETEPARIVARAFIDYGAYAADNAAWSVYGIDTEYSPSGDVMTEFSGAWGFPIDPSSKNVPWARDMDRLFMNLNVVDSWNQAIWQTVSVSNGLLGAGLGLPRVPWAPDIGGTVTDTLPPVSTAALSGSSGSGSWFTSSVGVTVSATDSQSGLATIQVRKDGGAWQLYTSPVTVSGDGTHAVDYYATDVAGNIESTHTANVKIDSISPASTSQVTGTPAGAGYLSPVSVNLAGTDGTSGVQSLLYRIDGTAQWTYGSPFHVAGNGTHLVEYHAVDAAGNSEAVHTLSILLTGASGIHPTPVTAMSMGGTGGANGWYVSNVAVTMSASSASGSATAVAYRLDDGLWFLYVSPFTVREGRHTLQYQSSDADGYLEALRSATINVDSTAPTIAKGADVIRPDAPLSWTGSDTASGIVRYEVSLDNGPFQSMGTSTSVTRAWTIGSHVATVRAWDDAGNQGTTTIPFRVDSSAAPPPGQPGPVQSTPLSTAPPGSLYMAIGFITLTISLLLLNRQKMELRRLNSIRRVRRAY